MTLLFYPSQIYTLRLRSLALRNIPTTTSVPVVVHAYDDAFKKTGPFRRSAPRFSDVLFESHAILFNSRSSALQRLLKSLCLLRNSRAPSASYSSVSEGLIFVEYMMTGTVSSFLF